MFPGSSRHGYPPVSSPPECCSCDLCRPRGSASQPAHGGGRGGLGEVRTPESIRVFRASGVIRVLWVDGRTQDLQKSPGTTLVWDRRQEHGAAPPNLVARWIHAAADRDTRVVVLVSSPEDASPVRPAEAPSSGTWNFPQDADATDSVLTGLGREYEIRWNRCTPGNSGSSGKCPHGI